MSDEKTFFIAVVGAEGHGSTMLTAALANQRKTLLYSRGVASYEALQNGEEKVISNFPIHYSTVDISSFSKEFTLVDFCTYDDLVDSLILGYPKLDAAILTVDPLGSLNQSKQLLRFLKYKDVSSIFVFVNRRGTLGKAVEKQVKISINQALAYGGYSPKDIWVVWGSALDAYRDPSCNAAKALETLFQHIAYSCSFSEEQKTDDIPFRMKIEDIRTKMGMGVLVHGEISHGSVSLGDTVEIADGIQGPVRAVVSQIEVYRKECDKASAGDYVNILLKDCAREQISEGCILSLPGKEVAFRQISAYLHFGYSLKNAGKDISIPSSFNAVVYFGNRVVHAKVEILGNKSCKEGDLVQAKLEFSEPVVVKQGYAFTLYGLNSGFSATGLVSELHG